MKSRQEKIEEQIAKIAKSEYILEKMKDYLEYLKSDRYQDWNSDLSKSLNHKRKKGS